jgi:hypothetical protein
MKFANRQYPTLLIQVLGTDSIIDSIYVPLRMVDFVELNLLFGYFW